MSIIEELIRQTGIDDAKKILAILEKYSDGEDISGSFAMIGMVLECFAHRHDLDILTVYDDLKHTTEAVIDIDGPVDFDFPMED